MKSTSCKKSFPSVCIMNKTCFDECFYSVWTGRHSFLYKPIVIEKFGVTAMLLRSLKQVSWKKSLFYIHYFHNNITMLLILQCYYFLYVLTKFISWQLFFILSACECPIWMFHIFLYKWNFWKSKVQKLSRGLSNFYDVNKLFLISENKYTDCVTAI